MKTLWLWPRRLLLTSKLQHNRSLRLSKSHRRPRQMLQPRLLRMRKPSLISPQRKPKKLKRRRRKLKSQRKRVKPKKRKRRLMLRRKPTRSKPNRQRLRLLQLKILRI